MEEEKLFWNNIDNKLTGFGIFAVILLGILLPYFMFNLIKNILM